MIPSLMLLAQSVNFDPSTWADLAKSGGQICIFIVIVVSAAIAITKWVIIPLAEQKNKAEAERQKNTIEIASKFQTASEKLDGCVDQLNSMHERCHARDVASARH